MTTIYVEQDKTKIVSCSLEWPGWCRFGKTEDIALTALLDSAPRYRAIAERAGVDFAPGEFVIVELVVGATTDRGAPSIITSTDTNPVDEASTRRGVALLQAAWTVMDEVIAASPSELRKGPRGGVESGTRSPAM